MGRFTMSDAFDKTFIQKVKDATPIDSLINKDVSLQKKGKQLLGLCPFHQDTNPSLIVSTTYQNYHCFACGAKGDAIEWMIRYHHHSFTEAITQMAKSAGITLPAQEQAEDAEREEKATLRKCLSEAQRIYRYGLKRASEKPRSYLYGQRGLQDETINAFGLGIVTAGIRKLYKNSAESDLRTLGLLIDSPIEEGESYDFFRYRIMIPIHDHTGKLVGFSGRTFAPYDNIPKYLNSSESLLFKKNDILFGLHQAKTHIRAASSAYIVEGYFDVMNLHQAGIKNVVSVMGTALSSSHLERLFTLAPRVIIAFDGDKAGRAAAINALPELLGAMQDGRNIEVMMLPDSQDPDSIIKTGGADTWHSIAKQALPLSEFIVEAICEGLEGNAPEVSVTRAKRFQDMLPLLDHAPLFKHALISHVAKRIGLHASLFENNTL